jgi:hypothetical protein
MNDDYDDVNWWLAEVNKRCINSLKKSTKIKKSNKKFTILLIVSLFFIIFYIFLEFLFPETSVSKYVGTITENNTIIYNELTTVDSNRIFQSIGNLFLFVAGIVFGFTIDEYRNKRIILEESCLLRSQALKNIIIELNGEKIIENDQAERCKKIIENGASQIDQYGDIGINALNDVIENIKKVLT